MKLSTLEDTCKLAQIIVAKALEGTPVILTGPLGAGKTTLTQQIGKLLDCEANISSPSYTLIHEYPSPKGLLVHIDAYRLESAKDLFSLGLDDYLDRARLVVVEWGKDLLPYYPKALHIDLKLSEEGRAANIYGLEDH